MHEVMGFKDNVNPPLLINSATDFSSFGPESPGQTPDETGDDDASTDDIRRADGPARHSEHKVALRKKRKHSEVASDPKIIELLQGKGTRKERQGE